MFLKQRVQAVAGPRLDASEDVGAVVNHNLLGIEWRRETDGTKPSMHEVYYSAAMAVACGHSTKDAALDGQVIRAK